jgi:two-component system response regulator CpxR
MRLLVIDDDKELCNLLDEFLRREGVEAEFVHNGQLGIDRFRKGGIDLVVLDVMLPGIDGFQVLRSIRKQSNVPVIMLTARGEDIDRIVGLEMGADDYLPKPFNARELAARIRAVLRRLHPSEKEFGRLEVNDVALDVGSREVTCAGRKLDLTTSEFEILEMLMRSAGRVLSRDQIMERLYDRTAGPLDRSIDMHVSHLRRKLGGRGTHIKTIRGSGYQFVRSSSGNGEESV